MLLKAAARRRRARHQARRATPASSRRCSASRVAEARVAFGDERLYVERFVADARHVEVQVAADDHGAVVHLGERDCSVQRRYQKVIEEAPAPFLAAEHARRARARPPSRFARAIGYRNLGTVEFVVDAATGEFFFLEMNCRIQVEHPVTEAVTGRDLVAEQLTIAAGRAAGLRAGRGRARRPRDRVPPDRRGRATASARARARSRGSRCPSSRTCASTRTCEPTAR